MLQYSIQPKSAFSGEITNFSIWNNEKKQWGTASNKTSLEAADPATTEGLRLTTLIQLP